MSNQIVITSGAKLRDLDDVIVATDGILSSVAFNVANGVPRLDENGKILVSQLPNSVMEFKGVWNAATNTPTLVNGTGNAGDVWLCNVAGTVDFGAGPIVFAVGDYAVYTGSVWARSSGATGTVTSVGVSRDGNALTITGSPVTSSGTINLGFSGDNTQYINGAGNLTTFPTLITSIGLTMPAAFNVSNSPLTANGTIGVAAAGYASQYIRGDGTLADFPSSGGGGSSVSYYFNGGTSQGTIGGTTYYEMSKTADTGAGVDFNKTGDGFIVAFLTDANDPNLLQIPAGNWNFEIYASMSSNGGTPELYAELYKYDGTTFTLIATSSHEILYDGVNLNLYSFATAVPQTSLTVTDRLAIKLYADNSGGKTTTIHTQDSHLCQVITTFSTGLTALNGLTAQVQYFGTGTSGSDFNIVSSVATHTFNIPSASATARGLITTGTQTIAGSKTITGTTTFTGGPILYETNLTYSNSGYTLVLQSPTLSVNRTVTLPNGTGTLALTSDISYPVTSVFGRTGAVVATSGDYTTTQVTEGLTNLYFTDARARAAISLTTTGSTGASTYNNSTGVLNIPNYADQYVGTVTSVAMSVPTGLTVSGSPITTSGTLAVTLTAGYSIPTTANQSTWTTAYNRSLTSAAVTGTTTKTLTLNQQDGGTITASWTDINTDAVTSVFGRTGAVVATEGDYTLTQLGDVTITSPTTGQVLKYNGTAWINDTDANTGTVTSVAMTVPTGLSIAGSPITSSGTLAVTFAAGYSIPTNASQTTWDTAYTNRITSLTVTGSSGASTLISNVLNIPTYTLSGLGGQPLATNLTSLSALTYASTSFVKMTAAGTFSLDTNTYLTTTSAASTYLPLAGGTLTGTLINTSSTAFYGIANDRTATDTSPQAAFFVNFYPPSDNTKYFAQFIGNWASPNTWGIGVRGTGDNTVYLGMASSGVINPSTVVNLQIGPYLALTTNNIGSSVQAYSASLTAIAALSGTSGFLKKTGASTWVLDTNSYITGGYIGTTALQSSSANQALTGITGITFVGEASDAASIVTTISGTSTYFDFNLADDNTNDEWRWRFTPLGATVYSAMRLVPTTNTTSNLIVSGTIGASNFSGSSSGTNTGDQTLSGLGGVPTSRTLTINGVGYDLSADRSWTIPAGVSGTGTANKIAKWSTGTAIADSSITDAVGTQLIISKNAATASSYLVSIYPTTGTNASILNLDNSGAGSFFIGRADSTGASPLVGVGAYDSVIGHTSNAQNLNIITGNLTRIKVSGTGVSTLIADTATTIQAIFKSQYLTYDGFYGGIQLGDASNSQNAKILFDADGLNTLQLITSYVSTSNKIQFKPGTSLALTLYGSGNAVIANDIQGGGDLYFNKATRTTIYTTITNQNLHMKSNGSGVLQFNNDNTGSLTMCVGGGNVIIGVDTDGGRKFEVRTSTYNRIATYFSGSYTSGFQFSDLLAGIVHDAGADTLSLYSTAAGGNIRFGTGALNTTRLAIGSTGTSTFTSGVETVARFATNGDSTIIIGGSAAQGASSGEQYISYQNNTTDSNAWLVGMDDGEDFRWAYGALGEITDANTLMKMSQSGNLGLGTISPSYKLHVVGDIYATGTLVANGGITFTGPMNQSYGYAFTMLGNGGSSAYNVNFLNSGGNYDQVTVLGSLNLQSTNTAFTPPSMTTTQRNALAAGARPAGSIIYNNSIGLLQGWNGSTWNNLW